MALSADDIKALRLLLKEEVNAAIEPFRSEFQEFRSEVHQSLDAVLSGVEKSEQEYLSVTEQLARLEKEVKERYSN